MFSAGATNFSAGFPGEKPAAVPIGVVPTSRPSPVTSAVPVSGPSQSLDFTNGLGEIPTPGAKPQVDSKTGKVIGSVFGGILGSALGGPLLALPLGYVGGQIGKKGMPNFSGLGKIGMPSLGKFASEAGFRETATGRAVTEAQRTGDWSNYYGNIERFGGDNISSGAVARAEAERARAERESGSNISEPKGGYDKSTSGWF